MALDYMDFILCCSTLKENMKIKKNKGNKDPWRYVLGVEWHIAMYPHSNMLHPMHETVNVVYVNHYVLLTVMSVLIFLIDKIRENEVTNTFINDRCSVDGALGFAKKKWVLECQVATLNIGKWWRMRGFRNQTWVWRKVEPVYLCDCNVWTVSIW